MSKFSPNKNGTYETGTIVDYKVNNNTTRRFHVIHDDGETLTLQDQKNIVNNVYYAAKADFITDGGSESEWNRCVHTDGQGNKKYGCSTRGPVTILPALESETNSWTNVNLQTYTPGTTSFFGNNKTGCTPEECSTNTFTMTERSGRARLITLPESWSVGCVYAHDKTCPKYMYNYLVSADTFGGIVDGEEKSHGYWTINNRIGLLTHAYDIQYHGLIYVDLVEEYKIGARAVVEIDK